MWVKWIRRRGFTQNADEGGGPAYIECTASDRAIAARLIAIIIAKKEKEIINKRVLRKPQRCVVVAS